jgi:hypothetical protein
MRLYDSKINGIFLDQNDPFIRHKQLDMIEFPSLDGKMQRRLLSVKQTFCWTHRVHIDLVRVQKLNTLGAIVLASDVQRRLAS